MSWFTVITPEQRTREAIEMQKNYGITGDYKKRYLFKYEQKQWIAPGYSYNNIVKGAIDCGLVHIHPVLHTQTWSIEMRDLEFDWNPQALPENYFIFAYPYRIDIQIDSSGQVIDGNTWVDYSEEWRKKYKQEIFQRIENPDRAKTFYDSLCEKNHEFTIMLLKNNPMIIALGNVAALNYKINYEPEVKGEFGECYTSELVKKDYFGEDIPLPLKTTWLERNAGDEEIEEWVRLGGLLPEKYPEEDFRRMLRKITGIFNLEVPVYVDFSEFYSLTKPDASFRQIRCCGMRTQSLIKDVWLKHEDLEMKEDGKGVIYG